MGNIDIERDLRRLESTCVDDEDIHTCAATASQSSAANALITKARQ
jgi:hypothetical protein